ncbi:kinase/pyrophosphorylase [Paenarthrobacter sp. DKR-5]|uniref:pyruvate, water dikinase regulatory protein n=1 Tax=Paenarthrobacter sp. DKR-5 TaxID=2835535 RepID=UPI001BDD8467|nr:pyruvate, water dikinase regulatory protein [Paenarthrobacter sp. DKR-5]MBT1002202.1 kinase/pyrophosphorylase [Paenarthrobacter sp. DKR-5]
MTGTARRRVYFLSDGTGITAETLGNTLLTQFPDQDVERTTIPFIASADQAREIVAGIDGTDSPDGPGGEGEPVPLIFSTAVSPGIRDVLAGSRAHLVDLLGTHIGQLEQAFGKAASGEPGRAHGVGNAARYQSRMTAVEYAFEHDDGQSIRALELAELILIAPSRCGKTPTTMYLALQHGILAANFPLVEEDFQRGRLPAPLEPFIAKCFGLTSNALRLSQIRNERRPESEYASLRQCGYELRSAQEMYVANGIPFVNSASMSVEEISATILQRMRLHH